MELNKLSYPDSKINFTVRHTFSQFNGSFSKFELVMEGNTGDINSLKANLSVDISSLDAGIPMLTKHLITKEEFFNAPKYPNANFVSTKVEKKSEGVLHVKGDMTIKDITKEIHLDVNYKEDESGVVINFNTDLKRSDFGLRTKTFLDRFGIISNTAKVSGVFKFLK
ncbi:U73 family octaprenyl pyrophosphate-binding small protease YceI [Candidatus Mancarchaeum acidiphilum]|uniref:U73 family octaprenyl pyrophosphate-binding small protease YceI n=1 Tax=Candidatus Mancarchaeum acidiphilum TaxID=1920749 RepID=A0A218NM52_9ARCH|nr:YceI family protein [Candidatus Mancarchaeum acidiphilum]ASI13538.1 U73 family octaprenyl pyrophosphate-binding small protease YceI [Candidatus Mancarchaeum acidiphilum]